ncbi:MAG: hydroxyacylglutathione hydrolase [Steroidobacterales bacterium]
MIIERVWAANPGRNFHYLVACEATGEALAIDPLNWQAVLAAARKRGLEIRQILNTHEHLDHTGGNEKLQRATGATILAHADAAGRIGGVARLLRDGDRIQIGRTVSLRCLDTPGHTRAHICAYSEEAGASALFSGDTLFNAGAGNCTHGGEPQLLFATFTDILAALPGGTRVFPGHEYMARNLSFALSLEPSNGAAETLLRRCGALPAEQMPVTTLAEEREVNPFFRLQQAQIIAALRRLQPSLPAAPDPRSVFLALRELRNSW